MDNVVKEGHDKQATESGSNTCEQMGRIKMLSILSQKSKYNFQVLMHLI
tara:strand:+ start:117 stop:263 length:147 start_codon:yes stop_codon:yes gene_type:complete